jgi:hypothetical protein
MSRGSLFILLGRYWETLKLESWHRFQVGKNPHCLQVGKSSHRHYYCHVRDITPPFKQRVPTSCSIYLIKKHKLKIYYKKSMSYLHGYNLIWC